MKVMIIKNTVIASLFLLVIGSLSYVFAECEECIEVPKGKIPTKFLDKSVKELPSGIVIWDIEEAMSALKDNKPKILWIDTRPSVFLKHGTIKKAIQLVCDLKGNPIPDSDKGAAISEERLKAEMKKIDPNINNVKVVFFCQGPKCHRSYNAAIRSVSEYGLDVSQAIWFRDGYPVLEKHIFDNPKLKKRIGRYLKGDILG